MQWVKEPVLSLLWQRFDSWPGNFHMPWAWPKKKKNDSEKGKYCLSINKNRCDFIEPLKESRGPLGFLVHTLRTTVPENSLTFTASSVGTQQGPIEMCRVYVYQFHMTTVKNYYKHSDLIQHKFGVPVVAEQVKNLTSIHEDLPSLSGLRIWCCCELQCRLPVWLGYGIAVVAAPI